MLVWVYVLLDSIVLSRSGRVEIVSDRLGGSKRCKQCGRVSSNRSVSGGREGSDGRYQAVSGD
jgi:hypothetical protein